MFDSPKSFFFFSHNELPSTVMYSHTAITWNLQPDEQCSLLVEGISAEWMRLCEGRAAWVRNALVSITHRRAGWRPQPGKLLLGCIGWQAHTTQLSGWHGKWRSVMAGCQEVISSPSAVCKQTFLMHAMKSWSYFGDQFCTPRKWNLITCLIPRALHQTSTDIRETGTPPAEGAALWRQDLHCVAFSLFYSKPSVSTGSYLRAILFLFLRSIKKPKASLKGSSR